MVTTLGKRYQLKPRDLEVALGPAIGPCCYEVKEDVSGQLSARWKGLTEQCLHVRNGKLFFDLRRLNLLQLEDAGIPRPQIFNIGPCTSCEPEDFFSYRRDSADSLHDTGRQLSFIGWQ